MSLWETLLGRRLRSEEQEAQKIGPLLGVPVLGLDALASAAYGPEAALTILLPLGAAGVGFIEPIAGAILVVLFLLYISYFQTIAAYPGGGGSYTVASQNLGANAGLLAASALSLDYILNVAVAISAGAGAVVSAVPALLPHTLALCLGLLALLTIVNLRGVREAGMLFRVPTYAFVALLGGTIAIGVARTLLAGGHPAPVAPPPRLAAATSAASVWVLLRAFSSGCTAMTGVEAVSNGVPLFREPRVRLARRTLTAIIAILALLLAGIAVLCRAYHIGATPPGQPGYQSVLSQLVAAVAGRGAYYYLAIGSVVAVLALSANTSFADFPRLCRALALDGYLPPEFAHLGRRLVFSTGIVTLAVLAGALLVAFDGITDRLIPLFAVGAFLAFTMSQLGMVAHWRRVGGKRAPHALAVNALGATATGLTLVVVASSKFVEGAWITLLVIPVMVMMFRRVRRFNDRLDIQTEDRGPLEIGDPPAPPPIVLVPTRRLDRVERKALRFALTLSPDVRAVRVRTQDVGPDRLAERWYQLVERPAIEAGLSPPALVEIPSAYREFFGPLLAYIRRVTRENPKRHVAVLVPEFVERRWYHYLVHSHRATLLKHLLLLHGGPQIIIVNTPWYLRD
ncbi:MAG TPA: APC family permease [Longimicrobiales bacterium]|nr:APC family permease [Longimicrobiales bacterium]